MLTVDERIRPFSLEKEITKEQDAAYPTFFEPPHYEKMSTTFVYALAHLLPPCPC